MTVSDDCKVTSHYVTGPEARKLIRKLYRKQVTYFARVAPFLYSTTPDECGPGDNPRGYEGSGLIAVSQKQALEYVNSVLRPGGVFEEKGLRLQVNDYAHTNGQGGCVFIG